MSAAPSPQHFTAELLDASDLSPTVRRLTFRPANAPDFRWIAGQYVELVVPASAVPRQPYSIASAYDPERPGRFELAVLRGADTGALHALPLGAHLSANGPLGSFTRERADSSPSVLIGTGTGVSPLRAMIVEELRKPTGPTLVLLFGCRSEAEVLFADEFRELARLSKRFRFEVTLSQPDEGYTGRRGYVQEHLAELVRPLAGAECWVCGRAAMVEECVRRLEHEIGIPRDRIFTETH